MSKPNQKGGRHAFVSFNGAILNGLDARISAVSNAALYGKGVFTTAAVAGGVPFLWDKHLRRLDRDANRLGIDRSAISDEALTGNVNELIAANGVKFGRVRITIFDEGPSELWAADSDANAGILIMTADNRNEGGDLRLGFSTFRVSSTSPLAGVKSCNYLEKLISLQDAKAKGFGEAIRINERGHITSGCMANIFWLDRGRLFTPSLSTGCLAGTTREFVLETLDCREVESGIEDLTRAEAIFLTSAGIGVVRAKFLEDRDLGGQGHPILDIFPARA